MGLAGLEPARPPGAKSQPETGNTIISAPMLATANPIDSVIAHATMHTTAVVHAYETPVFLPQEATAE